jgi:hypothetical protein
VCAACLANPYVEARHAFLLSVARVDLPEEVRRRILLFAAEPYIHIRPGSFCCALCGDEWTFKQNSVEAHVHTELHQQRAYGIEKGELLFVSQTGIALSRFRDGLGVLTPVCTPAQALAAARLVAPGPGISAQELRRAGCGQKWAQPERLAFALELQNRRLEDDVWRAEDLSPDLVQHVGAMGDLNFRRLFLFTPDLPQ